MTWRGQNEEDRVIAECLLKHPPRGGNGSVLDLGAHAGDLLSNTAFLIEWGWKAVLVEGSPRPLAILLEKHGRNPDVAVVGAVIEPVVPKRRIAQFHDTSGDFVSSASAIHKAQWEAHGFTFKRLYVPILGLDELLTFFPGPFDVISIDLEGRSADIFCAMPVALLQQALVVVVERDDDDRILKHAAIAGLVECHRNGENIIVTRPT